MRPATWLKILVPLLASMAGLVTLRLLGPDIIDQRQFSEWLRPLGRWAPVVFILVLAVRPLTLLPGQVFTAVGGLLFGTKAATLYALLGSFLAAGVTFTTARWLGSRVFKRWTGPQAVALRQAAERHGFSFAFLMCINPLMPTDVAIAAAAISGARFWPVTLGMLLGAVPGTLVTALFGSSLGQGKTIATAIAGAGMVLSLAIGAFIGRKVVKELAAATPPVTPPALPALRGLARPQVDPAGA